MRIQRLQFSRFVQTNTVFQGRQIKCRANVKNPSLRTRRYVFISQILLLSGRCCRRNIAVAKFVSRKFLENIEKHSEGRSTEPAGNRDSVVKQRVKSFRRLCNFQIWGRARAIPVYTFFRSASLSQPVLSQCERFREICVLEVTVFLQQGVNETRSFSPGSVRVFTAARAREKTKNWNLFSCINFRKARD